MMWYGYDNLLSAAWIWLPHLGRIWMRRASEMKSKEDYPEAHLPVQILRHDLTAGILELTILTFDCEEERDLGCWAQERNFIMVDEFAFMKFHSIT